MSGFAESHVEEAALEWLSGLGYGVSHGPDISPDGPTPERASYDDVVLIDRLRAALERLNPHLPAETLEEVLKKIQQSETPSLIEENRRLHRFLIEGVPVEVPREDGSIGGDTAHLIDFANPDQNDWLAVNQYTVIENKNNRRPDVVLFINGLPLAVIELKNPGDENATLEGAFNQLQTYKDQIPSLFRTNGILLTSDGIMARVGSLQDLVAFLGDLQAAGVDLYLDRQGIDTTTPGGKALFQMMGVFAEFERAMIRERINAGLARARNEGKRLGRPPGASKKRQAKQSQVQKLHKQGHSIRGIARQVGIATGTVQTYLKSA